MKKKWETIQGSYVKETPEVEGKKQEFFSNLPGSIGEETKAKKEFKKVAETEVEKTRKWMESPEGLDWQRKASERLIREYIQELNELGEKKRALLTDFESVQEKVRNVLEGKVPFVFKTKIQTGVDMPDPGRWYQWEESASPIYSEVEYECNAATGTVTATISPEAVRFDWLPELILEPENDTQKTRGEKPVLSLKQLETLKQDVAYNTAEQVNKIKLLDENIQRCERRIEDLKKDLSINDFII